MNYDEVLLRRLMDKSIPEPNSGCWLWTAALSTTGYGVLNIKRKVTYAHRLSYQLHKGEVGDMFVCHHCDTRCCVNPDHLFLGTPKDNVADMFKKGREKNRSRLTSDDVLSIVESDLPIKQLAALHHVHYEHIRAIQNGKYWKRITNPSMVGINARKSC